MLVGGGQVIDIEESSPTIGNVVVATDVEIDKTVESLSLVGCRVERLTLPLIREFRLEGESLSGLALARQREDANRAIPGFLKGVHIVLIVVDFEEDVAVGSRINVNLAMDIEKLAIILENGELREV